MHAVPRRLSRAYALFAIAALLGTAAPAAAINPLDLLGNRPKPFIEPDGFYRVILPPGFDCRATPGKRELRCDGTRGQRALLVLQVLDVPKSATSDLVALNEMERLKKKPHFKQIDSRREVVDGSPARFEKFSYDYLGNVEYPMGVQALYVVRENKLYVVHFESQLRFFGTYVRDLKIVYESFKPAALDEGGNPIIEDLEPKRKGRARTDEEFVEQQRQQREERDRKLRGGR
jgi:hypothetical protein